MRGGRATRNKDGQEWKWDSERGRSRLRGTRGECRPSQAAHALQELAQRVERAQIVQCLVEVDIKRDDLPVLVENDQCLAAEGFGLVAHLGEAAPILDG